MPCSPSARFYSGIKVKNYCLRDSTSRSFESITVKIAYLINQYPQPSQSFIRREIHELEQLGVPVSRFTLRRFPGSLPDRADQLERQKTVAVLEQGPVALIYAVFWALFTRPLATLRALIESVCSGWEPKRGFYVRIAYFVEACFLSRCFLDEGIDHVHAHFGTNSTSVAQLVRTLGGPGYSFTCHGPEEFDRADTIGLQNKVGHSSFVVAISNFCRSQLYRWSDPHDWHKIHVVRCGIDSSFLDFPTTTVPDIQRLICVARLSEQKGHLTLVEAAALVAARFPNLELLFVGDGPMRPQIEEAIGQHHLHKNVRLLGWKSSLEIRELVLSSRAMVLSSFAEGLPVVIMEALALGRPVISTSVMGIPDLVIPGDTGWLVPPADPTALAGAMEECLSTEVTVLTQMGLVGRALVSERHTAYREAERLLQLIRTAHAKSTLLSKQIKDSSRVLSRQGSLLH